MAKAAAARTHFVLRLFLFLATDSKTNKIIICISKYITHLPIATLHLHKNSLDLGLELTSRKLFYPRSINKIISKIGSDLCRLIFLSNFASAFYLQTIFGK